MGAMDFRMESSATDSIKHRTHPRTIARYRPGVRPSTRPRQASKPMATMGRRVAKLAKSQYEITAPLAHTDFNPDNEADRTRQLSLDVRRPSHAAASAYYSCALLESALMAFHGVAGRGGVGMRGRDHRTPWRVHSKDGEYRFRNPCIVEGLGADRWEVRQGTPNRETVEALMSERDRRGYLEQFLEMTTGRGNLERWWPLVSYLTRTLRLSDQRATSEWACSE